MSKISEIEIAPLRTLNDFLLESARFQLPEIRDLEKWGRRVTSNLLYYQSNYFLMAVIIFLIVSLIHPTEMMYGFFTLAIFLTISYIYLTNQQVSQFKKNHPIISVLIILSGVYLTTYMIGSLLVFLVGILLPISATFIHSSLRLRNLRNKIANRVEILGLKRTPMGIFLEELGLEQEVY